MKRSVAVLIVFLLASAGVSCSTLDNTARIFLGPGWDDPHNPFHEYLRQQEKSPPPIVYSPPPPQYKQHNRHPKKVRKENGDTNLPLVDYSTGESVKPLHDGETENKTIFPSTPSYAQVPISPSYRAPEKTYLQFDKVVMPPTSPTYAQAVTETRKPVKKEPLVLMPIIMSGEDAAPNTISFETALIESLSQQYKVYSGQNVLDTVEKVYKARSKEAKAGINCDESKCFQDVAMAFQTELIAVCNVNKKSGGYMLSLKIQNVADDTVALSKIAACKNCDYFDAIRAMQRIATPQK